MMRCFPSKDDDENILFVLGPTINSVVCSKAKPIIIWIININIRHDKKLNLNAPFILKRGLSATQSSLVHIPDYTKFRWESRTPSKTYTECFVMYGIKLLVSIFICIYILGIIFWMCSSPPMMRIIAIIRNHHKKWDVQYRIMSMSILHFITDHGLYSAYHSVYWWR